MEFSRPKLPIEASSSLRSRPMGTVMPFALMESPIYVFMRRNEKFVSVKGPLDFFTPEELERLAPFETFFVPAFVDMVVPFQNVARRTKLVLQFNSEEHGMPLSHAPFEVSDSVIRIVGPLWSPNHVLEPFFVAAFTNELCDLIPGGLLLAAREQGIYLYERGIFISSWMVFLALHLGITDFAFLNKLRITSFLRVVNGDSKSTNSFSIEDSTDTGQLFRLLSEMLSKEAIYHSLGINDFVNRSERVAQKIVSRLKRVQTSLTDLTMPYASIVGEKGFIDG